MAIVALPRPAPLGRTWEASDAVQAAGKLRSQPSGEYAMLGPLDCLRWVVGTALIYSEWLVYTTPLLRRSTALSVLWYLVSAAVASPFLAMWLPLELLVLGWLRTRGLPAMPAMAPRGAREVAAGTRGASPSRSRSPGRVGPGAADWSEGEFGRVVSEGLEPLGGICSVARDAAVASHGGGSISMDEA